MDQSGCWLFGLYSSDGLVAHTESLMAESKASAVVTTGAAEAFWSYMSLTG